MNTSLLSTLHDRLLGAAGLLLGYGHRDSSAAVREAADSLESSQGPKGEDLARSVRSASGITTNTWTTPSAPLIWRRRQRAGCSKPTRATPSSGRQTPTGERQRSTFAFLVT